VNLAPSYAERWSDYSPVVVNRALWVAARPQGGCRGRIADCRPGLPRNRTALVVVVVAPQKHDHKLFSVKLWTDQFPLLGQAGLCLGDGPSDGTAVAAAALFSAPPAQEALAAPTSGPAVSSSPVCHAQHEVPDLPRLVRRPGEGCRQVLQALLHLG
jgi:hypothetical protein